MQSHILTQTVKEPTRTIPQLCIIHAASLSLRNHHNNMVIWIFLDLFYALNARIKKNPYLILMKSIYRKRIYVFQQCTKPMYINNILAYLKIGLINKHIRKIYLRKLIINAHVNRYTKRCTIMKNKQHVVFFFFSLFIQLT